MAGASNDPRETKALVELCTALEELGILTDSNAPDNAFFTAFVVYKDGSLRASLFVITNDGTHFVWTHHSTLTRDGQDATRMEGNKHPITDIPGAARRITRILLRNLPKDPLDHEPEAVTYARERAGLTKTQLADECEVSLSLISEIESGTRNATPAMIGKLAKVLNCPRVVLERKREG